jgi:hypothetical protein
MGKVCTNSHIRWHGEHARCARALASFEFLTERVEVLHFAKGDGASKAENADQRSQDLSLFTSSTPSSQVTCVAGSIGLLGVPQVAVSLHRKVQRQSSSPLQTNNTICKFLLGTSLPRSGGHEHHNKNTSLPPAPHQSLDITRFRCRGVDRVSCAAQTQGILILGALPADNLLVKNRECTLSSIHLTSSVPWLQDWWVIACGCFLKPDSVASASTKNYGEAKLTRALCLSAV